MDQDRGQRQDESDSWSAVTLAGGAPDGTIYVAYQIKTSTGHDVRVVHSTDGGANWSAPVSVVDHAGAGLAGAPQLSVAPGGRVDVVWYDSRNAQASSKNTEDVYLASSTDRGVSFSTNWRITDRSLNFDAGLYGKVLTKYFYTPVVAALGNKADLVAWPDSRLGSVTTGAQDIFEAKVAFNASGSVPVNTLGAPSPPTTSEQASVDMSKLAYPGGAEIAGTKVVIVNAFPAAVVANSTDAAAYTTAAFAATLGLPVLFVDASSIPAATSDALHSLDIPMTLVVGGPSSVSDSVLGKLPGARRFSGANAQAISDSVARASMSASIPANVVYVANDSSPIDAAVAGAAVARLGGLLLVSTSADAAQSSLSTLGVGAKADRMVVIPGEVAGGLGIGALVGIAVGAALLLGLLILAAALWRGRTRPTPAQVPGAPL
ncbi:MAG: sialidase family protein [Acidimicrobiales bacterium]